MTGDHLTIDVLRYPGALLRPGDPDGAQPLRSLWINHLLVRYCALRVIRTAGGLHRTTVRQPAPSPVLQLPWLRTPLPNPLARAPAARRLHQENFMPLHCWYCRTAVLRVLLVAFTAPPSGSQPRRPYCNRSGLEPHCRTSRHARPQPDAFTERPLVYCAAGTATASGTAVLRDAVLRVLRVRPARAVLRYCGPARRPLPGRPGPAINPATHQHCTGRRIPSPCHTLRAAVRVCRALLPS